ncbi:MAG: AI-2E family transporter [Fimbriimonadaceae bacterium]|nr:AI-2E family transporter [Fimbriimonadaceae bacterium]QYK57080.1 MAG: AI-2E family transporter [Fimbriimonadaceae bacterium]
MTAVFFLWAVRGVLLPFILSGLIAVMLEPLAKGLRRIGLPSPLAAGVLTISFYAVLGLAIVSAAPFVATQAAVLYSEGARQWDELQSQSPDKTFAEVDKFLVRNEEVLRQFDLPTTRQGLIDKYIVPNRERLLETAQRFLTGGFASIFSIFGQLFLLSLTPIFVFFMLMDMDRLRAKLASYVPPSIRAGTVETVGQIVAVFKNYIRGLILNVMLYATVMTTVLYVLGVDYYFVLGVVVGTLYLIPIIGNIISSIIVFIVLVIGGQTGTEGSWFSFSEPWQYGLAILTVMFLVGTAYDTIITPNIVGRAVKLNPLLGVFVVFAASALFGLPGMLVAYPLAGAIKIAVMKLLRVSTSDDTGLRLPSVPLRHRQLAEA